MTKRVRKHRRKKFKIGRIIVTLLVLAGLAFGVLKGLSLMTKKIITKEYYISANTNEVTTYAYNSETEKMDELATKIRGEKVISHDKIK